MLKEMLALLGGRSEGSELAVGALGSIAIAILERGLTAFTSVILARFLGPRAFGTYAFAIAVAGILAIPSAFGTPMLVQRELARLQALGDFRLMKGLLIRSLQVTGIATALTVTGAAACLWLSPLQLVSAARQTLTLALVYVLVVVFLRTAQAVLLGLRRVILGQLPAAVLWPTSFLALLLIWKVQQPDGLGPGIAMGLRVVSGLGTLGVALSMAWRYLPSRVRGEKPAYDTARWFGSGLAFTFLSSLWVINSQTDLIMLGLLGSDRQVGLYRSATAVASLLLLVLGAISAATQPTISRLHALGDRRRLVRLTSLSTRVALAAALPLAAIFWLSGSSTIRIVFGKAYMPAASPLAVLVAGSLLSVAAGPVGVLLNMSGHERDTVTALGISALLNILLNLILIPRWGMTGAALASAASSSVWNALLVWRAWKRLGIFSSIGLALAR